jgi:hypothetical protein
MAKIGATQRRNVSEATGLSSDFVAVRQSSETLDRPMPENTGVRRRKEIGRQKFPGPESLSSYYEPVYTHFDVCAVFNVLSSALPGGEISPRFVTVLNSREDAAPVSGR